MLTVIGAMPFGAPTSRLEWETKVMGLVIIFIYAFFKFAWSYRLYNYVAIMVGAAPPSHLLCAKAAASGRSVIAALLERRKTMIKSPCVRPGSTTWKG